MKIINEEIKSFSFAQIKEEISKVCVIEAYKSGEIQKILEWLGSDTRKNVLTLKARIEKEISEEILHNKLWKEPDCDRARYYRENYPEIWAHTLEQMQMEEKAIFHGKSEN